MQRNNLGRAGCEHTLARLDDVHIPGALSAKLREAWQSCYYLPSYLRILVSPLKSRTKRPRLYTEVQDSQATGLLPTKTLHTGCLSDSGVCTAESTPSIRSNCCVHLLSAPNSCGTLLTSTCGLKTTAHDATRPYSTSQIAAVNSHVDQPTAPQDLARSDL